MSDVRGREQRMATKPCGCPDTGDGRVSRRSFLKGAAAVGALAGLSSLVSEGVATRLAFADTPYDGDVLVLLSLRGGFDGLQAIVPASDPDYPVWRPNIGIPPSTLIQLDQTFGMHPAMAALEPLWNAGTLGVVHAVGQAEPNRSHFEAMEEMERAAPGTSMRTGWLDRVLGLRDPGTPFQGMQVGSSLAAPAFLGPAPELAIWSVDSFGLDAAWDADELARWDTALRGLHQGAPDVVAGPAGIALGAVATMQQVKDHPSPENGAVYPEGYLGEALRDVARLIKSGVGLQVAAVDYGDWDMHEGMGEVDGGWMRDHLTELSGCLAAFATDLGSHMDGVSLVTLTEFGRTVGENGSGGSDHGYGQVVLMMGGGILGGQVHGQWPGLAEQDLVDGDLAATTDYRTILAEVLEKRCGAGSLSQVFPGLGPERLGIAQQRA